MAINLSTFTGFERSLGAHVPGRLEDVRDCHNHKIFRRNNSFLPVTSHLLGYNTWRESCSEGLGI